MYSKESIIDDINSFKNLKINWDGYGGFPLENESASNAIKLINFLSDDNCNQVNDISPNGHGTISFDWYNQFHEVLSIEVGSKTISYYLKTNNGNTSFSDNIIINQTEADKINNYIKSLIFMKLVLVYSWGDESCCGTTHLPFNYESKEKFVFDILEKYKDYDWIVRNDGQTNEVDVLGYVSMTRGEIEVLESNIYTLDEWFEKEKAF